MMYHSRRVEMKRGEQIKFVLRNNGELDHEFVLASTEENLKHAEEMKKNPEMEHDDPNAKRLTAEENDGDRLAFHQGRQVRIWLPDPGPPRGRHDRHTSS